MERPAGSPSPPARSRRGRTHVAVAARLRRGEPGERTWLAVLVALAGVLLWGGLELGPSVVPPVMQVLPLLAGGLLFGRRALRVLLVVVAACLVVDTAVMGWEVRPGALVCVVATGVVAYEFARRREETGLGGLRSDAVLVELRGRLEQQGRLPVLPAGWQAEAVVRPAGGGPFAGDFVVSACTRDGRRLEVALVDVSGKGVAAGTRALLLSGAMGGLLGRARAEEFLPAANAYLIRSEWDEGFATAVHVVVDLPSGAYALGSPGTRPPRTSTRAPAAGRCSRPSGPRSGCSPTSSTSSCRVASTAATPCCSTPTGSWSCPAATCLSASTSCWARPSGWCPGFTGGAERLVTAVAGGSSDDRGLVLLWRAA